MKTWMKKNSDGKITFDIKGLTEQEAITLCNALEYVIEEGHITTIVENEMTLKRIVNQLDNVMTFDPDNYADA